MMKAIILAAGMGKRLRPYTDDRPKSMVEVNGRPMLDYVAAALRGAGVSEIVLITGYMADKVILPGARRVHNPDYATTNMLWSLFCAESDLRDGYIFTFADIVYGPSVIRRLLDEPADLALVCDRDWRKTYVGRQDHPVAEANLVIEREGRIVKVGKKIIPEAEASGEFIGVGKVSARAARPLIETYNSLRERWRSGAIRGFQQAGDFKMAYLDDIHQELIDRGQEVRPVHIDGGWHEIDTAEDLARVGATIAREGLPR